MDGAAAEEEEEGVFVCPASIKMLRGGGSPWPKLPSGGFPLPPLPPEGI